MQKDIRIHKGNLQTAIHVFQNRETGKRFTLIAVAHVAESTFWDGIRAELDTCEAQGAEVHYELVADDIKLKGDGKSKGHPYELLAEFMGMQTQFKGLHLKDHWHNTDMTMSELLGAAKDPQSMWHKLNGQAGLGTMLEGSKISPEMLRRGMILLLRFATHLPASRNRNISHVLTDGRTDFAMSRMLARDADVVTLWGGGHLKRMKRLLRSAGYSYLGTSWMTAVTKDPAEIQLNQGTAN